MSEENEFLNIFLEETREHLEKMEGCLLELEQDPSRQDVINDLFRSVHTIKGSSAAMEYTRTSNLVHKMEDIIQAIRDGQTEITPDKIEVFLKVKDHLEEFVEITSTGGDGEALDSEELVNELIALKSSIEAPAAAAPEPSQPAKTGLEISEDALLHIHDSVSSGKLLFAILIKTREDSAFKIVRAWMAYEEVKRQAEIVASDPSRETIDVLMAGDGSNPPGDISFIALTEMNAGELERQLVSELSEIEFIHIEPLEEQNGALSGENLIFDEDQKVYHLEKQKIAFARLDLSEAVNQHDEQAELLDQGLDEILKTVQAMEMSLIEMCPNLQECERECKQIPVLIRQFGTVSETALALDMPVISQVADETAKLLREIREGKLLHDESNIQLIGNSLTFIKKLIRLFKNRTPLPKDLETDLNAHLDLLKADLIKYLEKGTGKKQPDDEGMDQQQFQTLEKTPDIRHASEQGKTPLTGLNTAKVLVSEGIADANSVRKAINQQQAGAAVQATSFVRIPEQKVGNLFDLLGELIIMQSQQREDIASVLAGGDMNRLSNNMGRMERVTRDIQAIAMSLRMVSIKSTFQKILRVGMHTAKELNRDIEFEVIGDETEVDRSVVEKLNDPLMHLIRNAVSHGIEDDPQKRIELGKNPKGTVTLAASSNKGQVRIEVSDDGKGLDTEKILNKAIEKGLAKPDRQYTDKEIQGFIFLPGFSTQEQINSVSGRGVGMNVVEEEIRKLGGKVEIKTEKGKGSSFILKIPINMATINGIVVDIDKQRYVLPTMSVKRIFKPEEADWVSIRGHVNMVRYRGELIPLVPINKILDSQFDISDNVILALEHEGEVRALPVKEVVGKQEIVIKPLDSTFKNLGFLSGSTIMGDGSAALILDVESFFRKGQ